MSASATPGATAPAASAAGPSLAARLGRACVGARRDLEVSRHVFRGEVAYVVHDPLTLQNHRLGLAEYAIFVHLDEERPLGSIFAELVERGELRAEDEEEFYRFVFSLHRLGFLSLPLDDAKSLHRRAEAKRSAETRRLGTAFLSLQIPLWNPERFLKRTEALARPFFTRTAALVWFAVVATAGVIVARNASEFTAPLADVFGNGNLPLLWTCLVLLKVAHEFGHAYACHLFGGRVPKMGVNFILFTPTAWVDASSSWGFPSRWRRLFVCLAGMYVELFLAALGVFVWSATAPGLVHSVAHNVVLLASVVTVAFNLNPLLRYDGYHALCDLLEVPNLRARATAHALGAAKSVLLGLPNDAAPKERRLRVLFLGYSIGCAASRVLVAVGLCAAIATRFYALGVLLGVGYLALELGRVLLRVAPWLWSSPETAGVRARAVALSFLLFALLPLALAALPTPPRALVDGVVAHRTEAPVCTEIDGELAELLVEPGDAVHAGDPIARLATPGAEERVEAARARLAAEEVRARADWARDPSLEGVHAPRIQTARAELAEARRDVAQRWLRAPVDGVVLATLSQRAIGTFLERGAEVARVGAGPVTVRALCSQEDFARAAPAVGATVEFRAAAEPGVTHHGTIERVVPNGGRALDAALAPLSELGGGGIAVDPRTREASRAHFELVIALDAEPALPPTGSTGAVRLAAPSERFGNELLRRAILFLRRLSESG